MFCCCAADTDTNNIVQPMVQPLDPMEEDGVKVDDLAVQTLSRGVEELAQKQKEEDAEQRRKAAEEADAAQRRQEEEAKRKRTAEEEAAAQRQREEADKKKAAKEQVATEEEARRQKQAAEAAAAKEAACSLPLTFRDATGTKTYTVKFTTKPLGLDFNQDETPVRITKAFGAAKKLGVTEGSCLINIAGTDVEKHGFGEMLIVLKDGIAPLKPDGLVIDFRDTGGQLKSIVFPTKPLGMDFDNEHSLTEGGPVKVKSVHGSAQCLGVEADWVLTSIGGSNIENMDFDQIFVMLRAKMESLPSKD